MSQRYISLVLKVFGVTQEAYEDMPRGERVRYALAPLSILVLVGLAISVVITLGQVGGAAGGM